MRFLFFIQRLLAAGIDLIIVYLPMISLSLFLFKTNLSLANLMVAVLFVIYNLVAVVNFAGRTVGKYFARLQVQPLSASFLEMGQGEAAKILYFLPFVGPVFMLISVISYAFRGKFLHDWIGRRDVVLVRAVEPKA